jgi:rare lipoprotein A
MKKATVILIILIAVVFSFPAVGNGLKPFPTIIKGKASWYSQNDQGILLTTANMEKFDDSELTCAIWELPFNTVLKVTNLENGKSVVVRVNDRGPARRLNRAIDLTKTAFSQIADIYQGIIDVSIELL